LFFLFSSFFFYIQGAIIGAIIGVIGLVGIVSVFFVYKKRRGGKKKKTNVNDLPDGWSSFIDPATGYPCYVDLDGETHWDKPETSMDVEMQTVHNPMGTAAAAGGGGGAAGGAGGGGGGGALPLHSRTGTILPDGWSKDESDPTAKYYYNDVSGETAWEAPPGSSNVGGSSTDNQLLTSSHVRSETILPSNWEKDISDPTQKYYYNNATGETAWEAPEGSTGGSTGM